MRKKNDIDDKDIEIAIKNGISPATFKNRVRYLGWSVERARTVKALTPSQAGLTKKGERNG